MTNAFESGARKAIPAVLVYVRAVLADGERVLMVHRNAPDRPDDYHAGKWNGLGGKCEPDESFVDAARREVREESGLELGEVKTLGVLQFPSFKAHKNEDWLVFVLTAEVAAEVVDRPLSGPEGDLHWKRADELLSLNLWPGDRYFMEHVIARRPFAGTIWYQGKDVVRAEVRPLG